MARLKARPLFDPPIVRRASLEALRKLDPRVQLRNPVMFVVLVTAVLTTVLGIEALRGHGEAPAGFILAVSVWLWFTVVFANFAEAMAEGRGKAQAEALRRARGEVSPRSSPTPPTACRSRWSRPRCCARATRWWWRPATSFPATA